LADESFVRLIAWNLNHRAARRRIPDWIASTIAAKCPDLVVLTEYVEGPDHGQFLAVLCSCGLSHASLTSQPGRQNQVLLVSREAHVRNALDIPDIHPSVPSNVLEVTLERSGVSVLGFRMPAFNGSDRALKRPTWDWLLREAESLRDLPALITGDFNTAIGDSLANCGDCLKSLIRQGWRLASPAVGDSWYHPRSGKGRRIDHLCLSRKLLAREVEYCWDFRNAAPEAVVNRVGSPDHAMLVAEIDRVSA
jgi:exonuclease III